MPLYEYRCQKCGKVSEILQSLEEKPARICPHCGGRLKKLHSTPAIQFKGTGWYVTDYAGKKGGDSSAKDAKPSAKSESGGSTSESSGGESKKSDAPASTPSAKE